MIPQKFRSQELIIEKKDMEFELLGLITGKNGKNRFFLKNILEKDESFKEISGEKSLNWLRMWKEIVLSHEKPRFLFYLE